MWSASEGCACIAQFMSSTWFELITRYLSFDMISTRPTSDNKRTVVMDNFFTSLSLLRELRARDLGLIGASETILEQAKCVRLIPLRLITLTRQVDFTRLENILCVGQNLFSNTWLMYQHSTHLFFGGSLQNSPMLNKDHF
jgi:hypothetical protein